MTDITSAPGVRRTGKRLFRQDKRATPDRMAFSILLIPCDWSKLRQGSVRTFFFNFCAILEALATAIGRIPVETQDAKTMKEVQHD